MPQALITGLTPSWRSTELSAVFGSWLALMGRSSLVQLVQGEGRSRRYVASGRPIHRMGKCRYELRHRDIETSIHKLSYSFPFSPGEYRSEIAARLEFGRGTRAMTGGVFAAMLTPLKAGGA